MFQFAINSFLVVLASLIQITGFVEIIGVKPNLVLALIVSISVFETKWIRRIIFISIAALLIKSSPYIDFQTMAFIGVAVLGIALVDYLPWHRQINWLFALIAATLAEIVLGIHWFELGIELVYNLAVGLVFMLIIPRLNGEDKKS